MSDTSVADKTASPTVEMKPDRVAGQDVATRSAPIADGDFQPHVLRDALEAAKFMAQAGPTVPPHCQDNPGVCFAVIMRALNWRAEPFGVASQSYVVKSKDGSLRIAWMAQLIHAVIVRHGNLVGDLQTTYSGEGPTRRIKVTGTYVVNGIQVTREYESPEFQKIAVKNSPVWHSDPDQQFHYYGCRAWARKWRAGVLYGIYTPEEIREGIEGVSDAERALAIEHRPDALDDNPVHDPDAPPPGAPLTHRLSYALEQVPTDPVRKGDLQAVFMRFQDEIEATGKEAREKLRGIYALHLRRVAGDIAHEDAMETSRAVRDPEA